MWGSTLIEYLDRVVSLGIVHMVSGRSRGSPFLRVHLGICFSLCWGLSKTHLGVFSVAVRGEEGWVGVVRTALVVLVFLN